MNGLKTQKRSRKPARKEEYQDVKEHLLSTKERFDDVSEALESRVKEYHSAMEEHDYEKVVDMTSEGLLDKYKNLDPERAEAVDRIIKDYTTNYDYKDTVLEFDGKTREQSENIKDIAGYIRTSVELAEVSEKAGETLEQTEAILERFGSRNESFWNCRIPGYEGKTVESLIMDNYEKHFDAQKFLNCMSSYNESNARDLSDALIEDTAEKYKTFALEISGKLENNLNNCRRILVTLVVS